LFLGENEIKKREESGYHCSKYRAHGHKQIRAFDSHAIAPSSASLFIQRFFTTPLGRTFAA
jgi:hypothetical protein